MSRLPRYEVRMKPTPGAPYVTHSIYVRGVCIASRLGPYGAGEVERIVREYVAPAERPQQRTYAERFLRAYRDE